MQTSEQFPANSRYYTLTLALLVALACVQLKATPIITSVVETGGFNEPTDTVAAKWTGETWSNHDINEPVLGLAVGSPYTVGLFGNHAPAMVDRAHRYTNASDTIRIPNYLIGGEYIMSGNDNRDRTPYTLDVTVSVAVNVFMLIDNRMGDGAAGNGTPPTFGPANMQWIVDEGWTPVMTGANRFGTAVPDEVGIDEGADGTLNQWFSVYTRRFPAGTFQLKQADNTGQNMYGAVVTPATTGISIGLNFGADEYPALPNAGALAPSDRAGVVPQANWNNLTGVGGSASSVVRDFLGNPIGSSISVTWSSPNTWSTTGRGEENNGFPPGPDRTLMTGYLDTTDQAAGAATVTVSGLGPEFTVDGYDVIVYALSGVSGRGGAYSIGGVTKFGTGPASPTTFVEDPGVDHNDTGNYMRFNNLRDASFTLRSDAAPGLGFGAVRRAPINAVQIISRSLVQATNIFSPGDSIVIVNGVNDGDTDFGPPPATETVDHAIDRVTQKYLNFLDLGSGFADTPVAGPSIAQAIRFYTANDAEPRDPASYLLEGSIGLAGPWTTIASGALALPAGRNPGGAIPINPAGHFNQTVAFANTTVYTSYRVTFPTLKNAGGANSMQIAEVELLGVLFPGPARIVSQPVSQTVKKARTATFSVTADGAPPLAYQWFLKRAFDADFNPIPGGTNRSHTTGPAVYPDDDGSFYKVQVSNGFGSAESVLATLTVLDDTAPPVPVRAVGSATFDKITIEFDEELEATGAIDPFNYGVSGGLAVNAATLVGDRSVILTVSPAQEENTIYTVTMGGISDIAGNAIGSASIDFRSFLVGCGGLLFESYGGLSLTDNNLDTTLLVNPNYPNNPRERRQMSVFDTRAVYPDNLQEGYGARVRGLFIPSVSGNWVFYLGSDDSSRLFLNPNGPSAAGKVLIAEEPGCCGTWIAHTSLMTPGYGAPIPLTAGQAYYIEAIYKEGTGGDYLKVAARLTSEPAPADNPNGQIPISENAIPASMLGAAAPAGIAGTVSITQQPVDQTVEENRPATFTVAATNPNDLPICYQWRRDGTDIPGATGASYTTPLAQLSDNGAAYSVLVSIVGDRTVSANAVLHVTEDVTAPTVVLVKGKANLQTIVVKFDERIDPVAAVDLFNFQVRDSSDNVIIVNNITVLADGLTVELQVATRQTPGAAYKVRISGVSDLKGLTMADVEKTFNAVPLVPGFALREFYFNIGAGTAIADLRGHASYPFSPGLTEYSPLLEGPVDRYDNYGERISGYFVPPVSGNYNFYFSSDDNGEFWVSTDASPANLVLLAREPQWNAARDWTGVDRRNAAAPENRSTTLFPAGIPLAAGQSYYFEALMKEGAGGDNLGVAVQFPGAPVPARFSQSLSGAFIAAPADPAGASVTITQHPLDATATECRTATFTVVAQGSIDGTPNHPLSYRWQKNSGSGFQDILDAPNSATLSVFPRSSDNGATYRAIVYVPGAETASAAATLTVIEETEPPLLVSAVRSALETTKITVRFNELMDAATIGNVLNYAVAGVVLASAAVTGPQTVVLTASSTIPDNFCGKMNINSVTDCAGNALTVSTELGIEKPRAEVNGLLVIEAENYDQIFPGSGTTASEQWVLMTDKTGYSGAGAMMSFPDAGGPSPSQTQLDQSPRMRYSVNFTSAGTKYLWILGASGPGAGASDSLHIGTNGGHVGAITGWGAAFGWARNIQGGIGVNTFVVAAPGPYIIDIWMREDGTYIDKLLFRSDPSATAPAGMGPPETPRPAPYDPPTVAITSPSAGATIEACSTVTITANASVPCGNIASVEFFVGNVRLGADAQAPFEFSIVADPPGDYVLTARATDNHGLQTTSAAVNVAVRDTQPPTLVCPSVATAECGGGLTPVSWNTSATDACHGAVPVTCVPPSGSGFPPGPTTVTCTATDNAGNSASCSFTVNVVDTVPPQITCPADIKVGSSDPSGGAVVTFTAAASDACGLASLNCSPPSGSLFPKGTTDVTCTALDAAANRSSCGFKVTVNAPPTCVARLEPEVCVMNFAGDPRNYIVAGGNQTGCIGLNGSDSSDPDGDPLTHTWFLGAFPVSLDPSQEPQGGGTGSGSGTVILQGNTLTINIRFSGLSGPTTAAHIHAAAGPGTNAGVIYPLIVPGGVTEGAISQTVTLVEGARGFSIAQQLEQLANGLWYINIHTTTKPGGEIRGQLDPSVLRGSVVTACLPVGCHTVELSVSDGQAESRCALDLCVITAAEAVEQCIALVENTVVERRNKRPLIVSLKAAKAAFDRDSMGAGVNVLNAFKHKVEAQIARQNPAEALLFIEAADNVIGAVGCVSSTGQ